MTPELIIWSLSARWVGGWGERRGVPRTQPLVRDRGLLEPLKWATRWRCRKGTASLEQRRKRWCPGWGSAAAGSGLGMADLPVFIRKFLQDHSGPVFRAAYGKDSVFPINTVGCVCVTIFDVFWYCSKYPCQQEGLFLFLKPSDTLKKLGFKIFCIVCSLI